VTRLAAIVVHVRAENAPADSLQNLSLTLNRLDGMSPLTEFLTRTQSVDANGNLKYVNVPDGSYRLSIPIPRGTYVADLRQGGTSIYDSGLIQVQEDSADPVEIAFKSDGAKVEGVVVGADGNPATSGKVTLVPQGERRANVMFYRFATLRDGRFVFQDIAPGAYQLFAWENIPFGAEQNTKFMAPYESLGKAISLDAGAAVSNITLSMTRTP
jgi:hypothetical protein